MELDRKVNELQEMILRKFTFEKKLEEIKEQYYYLKDKTRELKYKLEDLDVDIKSLEKKSIIYIWYDIFTSKGKNVSKIEHDYKVVINLFDYIQPEMIELRNKIEKIEEMKEEYQKLKEERENLILESEKEKYEKLDKLYEESNKYKNRIRDINEAIVSGNYLDSSLKYLVDLLKQTKDWDNFDIFGRGLFLSMTKTNVFKQTDDKIKKLHYLANKFTRELKVINFYMDIAIDVSEIIHFIDYYENALYDDIKDKSRLVHTIENIKKGYEIITQSIDILKTNKEKYLKKLIQIEQEKQEILID